MKPNVGFLVIVCDPIENPALILDKDIFPLLPGAKRGQWRRDRGIESSDVAFVRNKPKVMEKYKHRCARCGAGGKHLHVHHLDDDHRNNSIHNLEVRCELCHAVSHIGFLGTKGSMAYLPEISQVDVINLFRTIAVAISMGGPVAAAARKISDHFFERFTNPVKAEMGTSNPGDFGNALIALSDGDYKTRGEPLRDVRVIFNPDMLTTFAANAMSGGYDRATPETWGRIFQDYTGLEPVKDSLSAAVRQP